VGEELGQDIPALMARAEESLGAVQLLLKHEYWIEAVSRAYYAMFYAATALLHSEGIAVSKHSTVIAQVGQYFTKTGKLDPHLHRKLIDAFDERQSADYGGITFDQTQANTAYQSAIEFVDAARTYLESTEFLR
jgi:uncharacterized protein (UPF0332 family)